MDNPYAAPSVDPTAPAGASGGSSGPRDWTVGGVIGVGWEAVKKNPVTLVGGFFLVLVISQIVSQVGQSIFGGGDPTDPMGTIRASLMLMPIQIVLGVYLGIGQYRVGIAAARDEPVDIGMFFSGYDRLLPGVIMGIIMYIGIAIGFMLIIVPGIILALGWALCMPLLADTDLGVSEILSESWQATKGQRLQILVFGFAAMGVALLGLLALGVGILVAYPVIVIASAEMYQCMTGRRGVSRAVAAGADPMKPASM